MIQRKQRKSWKNPRIRLKINTEKAKIMELLDMDADIADPNEYTRIVE